MHRLQDQEAAQWAAYANHQGTVGKKLKETKNNATTTSNGYGYEQNLENFRRNWQKAAAPYYAPSMDDNKKVHPTGPRSLDGNLHRQYPGSAVPDRRVVIRNDEYINQPVNQWSDTLSY